MAQQDVRYYLNGLLLEISKNKIKSVGTDGHRMGVSEVNVENLDVNDTTQIIVPRKGILELGRFLDETDAVASIKIGKNHIRVELGVLSYTSKLIEEAQEEVAIDYSADPMEIGFNSTYIIDAANALPGDKVDLGLSDSNSSGTLTSEQDAQTIYVVMPMRL